MAEGDRSYSQEIIITDLQVVWCPSQQDIILMYSFCPLSISLFSVWKVILAGSIVALSGDIRLLKEIGSAGKYGWASFMFNDMPCEEFYTLKKIGSYCKVSFFIQPIW